MLGGMQGQVNDSQRVGSILDRIAEVITTSASQRTRVDFAVFQPKRLGTKEAEMKIVGCDLHARQQTIAMVDTKSAEFTEKTLAHEGNAVREFYSALEGRVVVGIEATT